MGFWISAGLETGITLGISRMQVKAILHLCTRQELDHEKDDWIYVIPSLIPMPPALHKVSCNI